MSLPRQVLLPRTNNFDFLRVLAAALVLIAHQYALTGRSALTLDLGGLGVLIFFSISGFLVAQSWHLDPNPWRFAAKRFLRIWPGLIAVTLLCVLILGPLSTTRAMEDYFLSPDTLRYFLQLKLTFRNVLPGVFTSNPVPDTVNGSLWTIPLEVRWYFMLLLAGVFGILRNRYVLLVCAIAFFAYCASGLSRYADGSPKLQNTLGLFFVIGVCLYFFDATVRKWKVPSMIVAGALAIGFGYSGHTLAAQVAILPLATILIGSASTPVLSRFGRFGDLSYGIYIYAFPVQQTIVWLTGNSLSFAWGLAWSALVTTTLAYLSWHLVERPAIMLKQRLRKSPKMESTPRP